MRLPLKRLLHICGSLLACAAIFFMVVRLHSYLDQIDFPALLTTLWIYVLALSLFVSGCNVLLVLIWYRCLEYLGVQASFASAAWIYGVSQLGKYLPGNIFHLAGRQTLGMAENLPAGKTLKSMFWELAVLAGAATGVFCPPFVAQYFSPTLGLAWLFSIFVLCGAVVLYGVGRLLGPRLRAAMFWCILYLCCIGGVFAALLALIVSEPLGLLQTFMVGIAYIVAWFIGLVTPGAPAGLGIREGAMLFLVRGQPLPEADLLLAMFLCRIVTIIGDFFFSAECLGLLFLLRRHSFA